VLFCVYIDDLLNALSAAGVGCHLEHMFVGTLAYVDDIVLMSPTMHGMRLMLRMCDEYASDFDVAFNASKFKCLVNRHRYALYCSSVDNVCFFISGYNIEVVGSWPHLGHVVSDSRGDRLDVSQRRCIFLNQVNNVFAWFFKLDCDTKTRLFKSYCSDFYGCELWDLSDVLVQSLCSLT